jgi:hypothetical protein
MKANERKLKGRRWFTGVHNYQNFQREKNGTAGWQRDRFNVLKMKKLKYGYKVCRRQKRLHC